LEQSGDLELAQQQVPLVNLEGRALDLELLDDKELEEVVSRAIQEKE
jgi:hypothetical protein